MDDENEHQEENEDELEEEQEITEQDEQIQTKVLPTAKQRPKTWLSPSVGAVIKMAVEDIVPNNKNRVPLSNQAHDIVNLTPTTTT